MDLLLDTNILIDHFGNRNGFADDVHKVFAFALFGDATLWATANSFVDAFYVLRKGFDPHEVQHAFDKCLKQVKVCSVDSGDLAKAVSMQWSDLEDCVVSVCADKIRAQYIVTRDTKGFLQSNVTAITPTELLGKLKEQGIWYEFLD